MEDDTPQNIFEETLFTGILSGGADTFELSLTVHAGHDCRIVIAPVAVSTETYIALSSHSGKPGSQSEWLSFEGASACGKTFSSDHLILSGQHHGSDGATVTLAASKAKIMWPRNDDAGADRRAVQWFLRGFRGFRNRPVITPLGELIVRGYHKPESPDQVSGSLALIADDQSVDTDWFEQADALLEFVWRGLEFGHGGRLPISQIQAFSANEVTYTFHQGKGVRPHLPSIHFLNQSDFIDCLAARWMRAPALPEAVWTAVGWLNSQTSIDEVRFLNLMTALETILDNLLSETQTRMLPRSDFTPLKKELLNVLKNHSLSDEQAEIFASKIAGLNSRTLSQKLKSVLETYHLPPSIADPQILKTLTQQRNAITHTGSALADTDLWDAILRAREIIVQTVFSELGYEGSFESYADGHKMRSIDDPGTAEQDAALLEQEKVES